MVEVQGEKVVVINNQSPAYSLVSVSSEDIMVADGKVNPRFVKDIYLPEYALPSCVRVVCTRPFGDLVYFSVGRVSNSDESGFYIGKSGLGVVGIWDSEPDKLFAPLDTRFKSMRLEVFSKIQPDSGLLWWQVEFRYPTSGAR